MRFNDNPVQGTERKLTREEIAAVNMKRYLAEKALRDAERLADEGMRGYR